MYVSMVLLLVATVTVNGTIMCILLCSFICIIYSYLFTGMVYVYGVLQLNIWAMFHALGLCWGLVFPFHYRTFKAEGKIKYVHIATVIVALLVPTLPALLYLKSGYAALFTPTRVCTGRSLTVTYFAFLLPSSIILATTTFALGVVFWTILKVYNMRL